MSILYGPNWLAQHLAKTEFVLLFFSGFLSGYDHMYAGQCAKVDQMVRSQVLEGHAQESGDEVGPGRATGKDHSME